MQTPPVATDWRAHLIESTEEMRAILRNSRRIAVLGIKPESRADQPAHFVAEYTKEAGYEIIPVPVYYPDVDSDPDTPAPALTIHIPAMDKADLVLAVNEGDNSALPIESMKLLLPSFRVRFVRGTTDPLTLYYGRADLERPSYDLALLAPRLMGAPATEIPLGEEKALESGKPSSLPMTVFWVILGAAVLAMLFLIARLVKKGGPDAEPTVAEAKQ